MKKLSGRTLLILSLVLLSVALDFYFTITIVDSIWNKIRPIIGLLFVILTVIFAFFQIKKESDSLISERKSPFFWSMLFFLILGPSLVSYLFSFAKCSENMTLVLILLIPYLVLSWGAYVCIKTTFKTFWVLVLSFVLFEGIAFVLYYIIWIFGLFKGLGCATHL